MAANIWGPSNPGDESLFTFMLDAAEKEFPELDDGGDCECDELEAAKKKAAELATTVEDFLKAEAEEVFHAGPERLQPLEVLKRVHQTLMTHTNNVDRVVLTDMLNDVEDCLYWQSGEKR